MDTQEFADLVNAGIPPELKKYTQARAAKILGPVVQVDFAYTDSTSGTDRLNARNIRLLVQGWERGDKVEVEAVRSWKAPKFRRRSGPPNKIAQYIINYFKRAKGGLLEGAPYTKRSASKMRKFRARLQRFAHTHS